MFVRLQLLHTEEIEKNIVEKDLLRAWKVLIDFSFRRIFNGFKLFEFYKNFELLFLTSFSPLFYSVCMISRRRHQA